MLIRKKGDNRKMILELTKLYNTLSLIDTRGDNTKTMADCLRFVEQLIADEKKKQSQNKTVEGDDQDDQKL